MVVNVVMLVVVLGDGVRALLRLFLSLPLPRTTKLHDPFRSCGTVNAALLVSDGKDGGDCPCKAPAHGTKENHRMLLHSTIPIALQLLE